MKTVVLGSVTIDRIVHEGRVAEKVGGVVTYAGLTYRRHGLPVTVVTNVAAGDADVLGVLERHGVRCVHGPSKATTRFVNRVSGDERRQEMPAAAAPIPAALARPALEGAALIHLGPLHPHDFAPDLLPLVAAHDADAALDVQGYTRRAVDGVVAPHVASSVAEALACAAFVKADPDELAAVLAALGRDLPALMADFDLREVVVTEGRKGGCVHERSGKRHPYAAVPVPRVVDPTGAGDVFFAAYLTARLHARRSISEACARAAETAARHVAGAYLPDDELRLPRAPSRRP